MVQVPGVHVQCAANHWKEACDVHNANHPDTDHAVVDLHREDPHYFPKTDILWASPECKWWSQAHGANVPDIDEGLFEDPLSDEAAVRSRMLMFDVLRFLEVHRYRRVIVENVVDVAMLGKYRRAWTLWLHEVTKLGYKHRVLSLNSMHAQFGGPPAPQSRDRLYVAMWPVGDRAPDFEKVMRPQAWCPRCERLVESRQAWKPNRTVGRYRAQYVYIHGDCGTAVEPGWLPAAAAIDWTMPGSRIGDRAKPLADKTRARIAAGIARYWRPFTLEAAGNTFERRPGVRTWPADEVLTTLTTTATKALAVPVEGRKGKVASPTSDPLRTMTCRNETGLAFVLERRGEYRTRALTEPLSTLSATDTTKALIAPFVAELRGGSSDARPVSDPLATVTANGNHHALVTPAGGSWNEDARSTYEALRSLTTRDAYALVAPYYSASDTAKPVTDPIGTLTTRDRYALIHRHNTGGPEMLRTLTSAGHQSVITPGDIEAAEAQVDDCMFRMFEPHEVAAGMAFPVDYKWQPNVKQLSRRDLVKLAGNAVTPPSSRDLMYAVVESLDGAV